MKKLSGPCTFGMTKSRNCAIISQCNLLFLDAFSPMQFQFAYPFKLEVFFLVPINSIYDAFIASKIPTTKVSFQIWKPTEVRKGKIWRVRGMRRTSNLHSVAAAIETRRVGWCIILQEQNTSSKFSSSFFISPDAAILVLLHDIHHLLCDLLKIIHHDNALAIPRNRGHHLAY